MPLITRALDFLILDVSLPTISIWMATDTSAGVSVHHGDVSMTAFQDRVCLEIIETDQQVSIHIKEITATFGKEVGATYMTTNAPHNNLYRTDGVMRRMPHADIQSVIG